MCVYTIGEEGTRGGGGGRGDKVVKVRTPRLVSTYTQPHEPNQRMAPLTEN